MTIEQNDQVSLLDESSGTWRDGLITDGFSQPGYIEQIEFLYPELRFRFVPMLPEDVEAMDYILRTGPDAKKNFIQMAKVVAPQLKAWSFGSGAITATQVRRMRYAQLNKLYLIVCGKKPSDKDPLVASQLSDDSDELEPLESKLGN